MLLAKWPWAGSGELLEQLSLACAVCVYFTGGQEGRGWSQVLDSISKTQSS